ncbi:hypothetical protein Rin_00017840, partial [Candidatus Regiella insecticola 5.15]
ELFRSKNLKIDGHTVEKPDESTGLAG